MPNLFELIQPKYTLPKKVKLFEAFAGIGCQRMAFERADIDYEVVGISEIDKYALISYQAMHNECPNYGSITDIKGKDLPSIDVFTYSFPCTDLSKAGQQKGLARDTRSGLIFEVLRILHELHEIGNLPKVLIMENVVDLIQIKFIEQWKEIQFEIEQMGYSNYTFTMNAKDYGVAQNRDRVFMVSILGDYYYEQPTPIALEKRLKDYLEQDVDEKYYLSEKLLGTFMSDGTGKYPRKERFLQNLNKTNDEVANSITTLAGNRPTDNFIKIPEATTKGYAEAHDGDGVYINRPHQKRGVVQNQMIQTLKTNGDDVGVVDNMRIRKLTPKECWRLMGIDDSYFDKASKVVSNSQLYKQAGNGIVVDVFATILKQMRE
jgi:DNA (cytosine-5)-methyltransferase 1